LLGLLQLLETTGDQGTSQAGAGCSDPVGLGLQARDQIGRELEG
jgi:hypothetical protein